ncbi:MAG: pyridoxine 5'-phosphate synthase [Deltaproteobacteria bacterium]|nr:MAG: pyridoxine 5'-phosphate synthase [Deltaproteobacteria bacterium]
MTLAREHARPALGVNVDHVATIRQARGTRYPDPVAAAMVAELAGADQITVHLREDRRHIQERDVSVLREVVTTRLNLEMAMTDEMLGIALDQRPSMVTLVPERREERTTEGGLDVRKTSSSLERFSEALGSAGITCSAFVAPDLQVIEACAELGIPMIELHTGDYAHATGRDDDQERELHRLRAAAEHAQACGLTVAAGHGLDYRNVGALTTIPQIVEYNIGHAIVARAIMVGFDQAVREMLDALNPVPHRRH